MPGQTLRCHPSIILEGMLQVTFFTAFILFMTMPLDLTTIAGISAAVLAAGAAISYRRWKLTTITFGETEVVVERDTVFKLKKNVPYSKIATVNVNRGIINRLFGTSKLLININSGHNAMAPEVSLTFKQELADRIRADISERLHAREACLDEEEVQPLVKFSPGDVIVHGLFSVSTPQTILGFVFLAYSAIELYFSTVSDLAAGGSAVVSLIMFFVLQLMPSFTNIIRYYNFKVYRKGDVIHLEHGMIRTYRTSFSISRINAVRVKSSLVARLLHRSCIEAEVVGVGSAGGGDSTRPTISLLKDDATTQRLLRELVPEFIYDHGTNKQPRGALDALRSRAAVASLALVLVMAYPSLLIYGAFANPASALEVAAPFVLPALTAAAVAAMFYAAAASYRIREFDAGEDLFMFVNGVLDRETVVMSYDKVQMVWIVKGPLTGRFGVAGGRVFLLSSTGTKVIRSGLFAEERLESINETVMARITSGKHDPRRNSI